MVGARLLFRMPVRQLRLLFVAVIVVLAVEMIYHGIAGEL
jgi:uncharacterized membrane protein YfcA